MIDIMKNRRTIRKYTTQDISEPLLNELLEVAARASNTGSCIVWSLPVNKQIRRSWLRHISTSR